MFNPAGMLLLLVGGLLILMGVRGTYKNVIEAVRPV